MFLYCSDIYDWFNEPELIGTKRTTSSTSYHTNKIKAIWNHNLVLFIKLLNDTNEQCTNGG